MRFIADLHLHSRFARATSQELNPVSLHRWSALKGITVVGTGDLTHPVWMAELAEYLEPAEAGLYQLRPTWREPLVSALPSPCRGPVRFLLTGEISTIYKQGGRTRKVHSIVMLPSLAAAAALNGRLSAIGNLTADGRPILGLSCRDLLAICLEVCSEVLFIPAHIWTPHFSVLGASSGFDSLEECFGDLLPHVHAVETGLSSDPPMNWQLSALDRVALVSNSDAHSPAKLGREATCFDTELSYRGIFTALSGASPGGLAGTIEFYPEEGKYHYDGHRNCGTCWHPRQTVSAQGRCPVCGRPVTVGVLHRVARLADRPEGAGRGERPPFDYIIPLAEVIASSLGVGVASQRVQQVYHRLLAALGPELHILRHLDPEELSRQGEPLVAAGLTRMRRGEVAIAPGYDGEFGRIEVFTDEERQRLLGQLGLLGVASPRRGKPRGPAGVLPAPTPARADLPSVAADRLDADQQRVVQAGPGPLVVVAGPGSGKTRVLVSRVVHLVQQCGVSPQAITLVTFTHRAANELRQRLERLLPGSTGAARLRLGTFHSLALAALSQREAGRRELLAEAEARQLLVTCLPDGTDAGTVERLAGGISLAKAAGVVPTADSDPQLARAYEAYQQRLCACQGRDYDDLLLDWIAALEADPGYREQEQRRSAHLLVDEFQDLNPTQYRLVRLLAGNGEGLVAIGDPDQAIYAFRGASPALLAKVNTDWPQATQYRLAANYRTQAAIVAAAAEAIDPERRRPPGWWRAVRDRGARLRQLEAVDETGEAAIVVEQIDQLVGGLEMHRTAGREARYALDDLAVLYRTGAQAGVLEEALQRAGLPFRSSGSRALLNSPAVRAAVAFARYLADPGRPLRLLAVVSAGPFQLAAPARADLEHRLNAAAGVSDTAIPPVLAAAVERYQGLGPAALFAAWRDQFGPDDDDLGQLARLAQGVPSMAEFLRGALLGRGVDYERRVGEQIPSGAAVNLLTLHAAKGLEFPVVFICGVESGLLPHREAGDDMAEERRLFYVGMTRARDELVLLRARTRFRFGERRETTWSPFIDAIDPAWLEREAAVPRPRRGARNQLSLF